MWGICNVIYGITKALLNISVIIDFLYVPDLISEIF